MIEKQFENQIMGATVERITDQRHLDRMTEWMYGWWGKQEGYSMEAVRCSLSRGLQSERLPQTFGLYLDGELIGMYQITMSDLFVRPDLYPWLANVYIDPGFRGMGYGRVLLSSVRNNAEALGLHELFLFTTLSGVYEKYGWEYQGEIDTFLEPKLQRLYRLAV